MLWLAGIMAIAAAPQTAGRAELSQDVLMAIGRKDFPAAIAALDMAATACAATKPAGDYCLDLQLAGANIAWRASDVAGSEKFARAALETANRALPPTHKDREVAHNYLVRVLENGGNYAELVPVLRSYLVVVEAQRGPNDPLIALIQRQLGESLFQIDDFAGSEVALRRAIALFEQGPEAGKLVHGRAMSDLAATLRELKRSQEAESLARQAVAIFEAQLPGDARITPRYRILAMVLNELGRYAEAEAVLRKALALVEPNPQFDRAALSTLYANLAFAVDKQGRFAEGEPLNRKVLALQEAVLPPGNRLIAQNYTNLAWNLQAQGKFVEAEAAIRTSVRLRETYLKPGDPGIATGYEALASVLSSQERREEADVIYRRVLAMREAEKPRDVEALAFAYSNLAANLAELDRHAEGEPLLRKAVALAETFYAPDHPELAVIYDNLADNVSSQQRFTEAEPYHRKALAVWRKGLPATHPLIARAMINLGRNLESQKRTRDAEPLMRQARAIVQNLPAAHPERINGDWTLAALLRLHRMSPAEARSLYRRAEAGAMERMRSFTAFDATAQTELRKYAPIFAGQIAVAWQLSEGAARR
jgi:tetratricopeptide (TPR) repeat protein